MASYLSARDISDVKIAIKGTTDTFFTFDVTLYKRVQTEGSFGRPGSLVPTAVATLKALPLQIKDEELAVIVKELWGEDSHVDLLLLFHNPTLRDAVDDSEGPITFDLNDEMTVQGYEGKRFRISHDLRLDAPFVDDNLIAFLGLNEIGPTYA